MNYLLLAEEKAQEKTEVISISKPESPGTKHASTKFQSLATAVLEFFVSEGSALLRAQFTSIAEPTSGINTMTIRISISFSVIAYSLLSHPRLQGLRQRDQLKNILLEIKTAFKTCLQNHDERADFADITFVSFSEFLGPVEQAVQVADLLTHGTIAMSQGLDHHFWHEVLHSGGPSPSNIEPDGIELDEEFESHTSKSRDKSDTFDVTHHEIPAATNVIAFRSCIEAKICFFSGMKQSQDPAVTFASQAASSVIHYLTSLKASDFVLCRNFLRELLDSGIPIIEDDADTLLQYLTHVLIRPYETERSEVSLGVALDIMTCLADMWINNDDSEIAETGSEVYSWFIKNVLKTGIASPHVQTCISKLLQKVIKLRPEYAKSLSLSSARTCLFEVLRKGNLVVKYHIGKDIAEIFGLFVLKEHEYILEDVIENLPKEKNWIEGIALRIFVLAHLAGAWSTLLRKCVYSIFETPKHIPEAAGYAKHGLDHITRSLKLAKSQDLFKLFASQIFYTWLGADQLRSIPYEVFDYATLPKLLVDVQDEIVGQIIIRSNEDEAAQLAEDLSSSFGTLLELSFSKAAAYSIGRDMSLRHDSNNQVSRAEVRLRQYVGKEQYALSISIHFAKIMALFFKRMDVEGQIEKGFQRRAALAKAYSAYQEILSKCAAERSLPPGHQPLFNARYLFDQIEFLCRRTSYDAESLWLPELYVFVFREILNGIHPELGSINACSGLRKLRILISLAGITALEDYPLEMALHSLRPYLTDAQCADDAIGIVQYLLEHGASYLTQIPSFLAGNSVSTLTSMKAFFESTQDSTTQESQFRTTMSRAQSFHTWFVGFLEKYKSPHLDEDSARCFKTIIRTASKIQNGGNARLGTYESELLLEVLEDQRSGRNLLDHSSVETILKFLCSPFEVPSDFRDDILGSDQQAARYAPTVWKTCQRGISSSNYLLWAGRVLGRAYAGKGLMDREMAFETNLHAEPNAVMMSATTPSSNSRSKILHSLCNLLLGDRSTEVGLVESTLRSIATGTDGTEYSLDCEQSLAPSLARSMLWRQYRLPATDFSTPKLSSLQECVTLKEHQQGPEWIQQLCKALANTARDDPILSELIQALDCINGLAEEVFPYILHLVLLREAGTHQTTKSTVSDACCQYFNECINDQNNETVIFCVRILLNAILYLRTQPLPQEASKADRFHWLDLDYQQAAAVALKCSMYKTAMLFVEVAYSVAAKASRRTSGIKFQDPTQLLLEIFENIDEQDAFYGVQQPSSLSSMMARLEYEHAGFKSLSFRGAHYDGQIRYSSGGQQIDEEGMVRALDSLDLNGLSQSVLGRMTVTGPNAIDSVLRTARKLEQWDITAPASRISTASTLFRAFQSLNYAVDSPGLLTALNTGFADSMSQLMAAKGAKLLIHATLGALAILTEVDEVFSAKKPDQLLEVLARFGDRETWMHSERLVMRLLRHSLALI